MRILVLAPETDCHAPAVIEHVRNRGHHVDRIVGTDFPVHDSLSLRVGEGPTSTHVRTRDGRVIDLSSYDTVWRRRGEGTTIDRGNLHPDDQKFAYTESQAAAQGLRDISERTARWINPRRAGEQIENKPFQIDLAARSGLSVPDTLISNDADDILAFYDRHDDKVIYKALTPPLFEEADGDKVSFVGLLPRESVSDRATVRLSPGIYQPYIEKAFELRVNVFGDKVLATKIDNQHVPSARVDWRSKVHLTDLSSFSLPSDVETTLLGFMRAAGLVFGAVDMIVTPDGQFVFLEVNQMGQFLWIDVLTKQNRQLEAMSDLLVGSTTAVGAAA